MTLDASRFMIRAAVLVLPLLSLLLASCATPPEALDQRFVLSVAASQPSTLVIVDARSAQDLIGAPVQRGYRVADEALEPKPRDYLPSQFMRAIASHEAKPRLEALLASKKLILRKFEVEMVRPDLTSEPSKHPQPGFAAFEYLVNAALEQTSRSEAWVSLEVELDGKRYHHRTVGMENVVPFSHSPIAPAAFAVKAIVDELAEQLPAE
jgi:hypothetical protein